MSSYTRLPSTASTTSAIKIEGAEGHGDPAPLQAPSRGAAVAASAHAVAAKLERGLSSGLTSAGRAFAAPKGTEIEGLLADSNLPELELDDPIASLAIRLDRESDLWRNFSLREIARLGWADRVAQSIAIIAVIGDLALGTIAGLSALIGGENAHGKVLLLGGAALILSTGALLVALVTKGIRRTRHSLSREALARADLAELRLHRVGIALAWRKQDTALYQEALARLERDAGE